MTDEISTANNALLRRFYREVYGDWNMALVYEVVSTQFATLQPLVGRRHLRLFRVIELGLRWWRDVLIRSQPKRYLDDR